MTGHLGSYRNGREAAEIHEAPTPSQICSKSSLLLSSILISSNLISSLILEQHICIFPHLTHHHYPAILRPEIAPIKQISTPSHLSRSSSQTKSTPPKPQPQPQTPPYQRIPFDSDKIENSRIGSGKIVQGPGPYNSARCVS